MTKRSALLISSLLLWFNLTCQSTWPLGMPTIQYYSTEDYHAGMQNYAITQDHRGLIYIANNLYLIEYDGTDWRELRTSNGTKVRSVYAHPGGRIYVGSQNEFGYFMPDDHGRMTYRSLKNLIPEAFEDFEDVWEIFPTREGLLFVTTKQLMWYEDKQIEVISLPSNFENAFYVNDQLYASFRNEGMKTFVAGNWKELPYSDAFKGKLCTGLITFSMNYDLISTNSDGLYLVNGHEIVPFAPQLKDVFVKNKINAIHRTQSGTLAVGTNAAGLYLLNKDGKLIKHINKEAGLNNRTVISIFEDFFGNLWLGMNNGIAKVEWQPPFSAINENMGLPGTGYAALSENDQLYLGTNNGLYSCRIEGRALGPIMPQKPVFGQIYSIQRINEDIFVCGHEGAWVKDDNGWYEISDKIGWWKVLKTDERNKVIAGNYDGIYLFKKSEGRWRMIRKYPSFDESSRVMEFDRSGRLWITHAYKGVFAFDFSRDYEQIITSYFYDSDDGFPSNILINVFPIDGRLVFPAETGIYVYDSNTDRFVIQRELTNMLGEDEQTRYLIEDSFGNIYFITRHHTGILKKNQHNKYEKVSDLFNRIHPYHNDDLDNISLIGYNSVLYSSKNGFIHYDNFIDPPDHRDLILLLRKVELPHSDSTLFYGTFYMDGEVVSSQPGKKAHELDFKNNSITFKYSVIDFISGGIEYRTILEGFEESWSGWSSKNERGFTNLREGDYTFKVQALDVYNRRSPIQEYSFRVLPPWYRSTWAYLGYALLTGGAILLLILFYNTKHTREKQYLIEQQEAELKKKEDQLDTVSKQSSQKINQLRNEKLRSEIRHKTRELANSTMHVIEKNNLISNIKDRINDLTQSKQSNEIKKELKRIVKEIDRNLEQDEDWHQFELLFDEVYVGFLQQLQQDYPSITPQEIKLSAYLKMGMSSKEIANLMKISVRGVEIGRYRLRKKLGLETGENLTNFMLNYGQKSTTEG